MHNHNKYISREQAFGITGQPNHRPYNIRIYYNMPCRGTYIWCSFIYLILLCWLYMGICKCRAKMYGNFRTRHGHRNSNKCLDVHFSSYNANTLVLSWKRNKRLHIGSMGSLVNTMAPFCRMLDFVAFFLRYFNRWVQRISCNFQNDLTYYFTWITNPNVYSASPTPCYPHTGIVLTCWISPLSCYLFTNPKAQEFLNKINSLRGFELGEQISQHHHNTPPPPKHKHTHTHMY